MKSWMSMLALVVATAGSAMATPPAEYPELAADSTRAAFVVARVLPGAYLPQFEDCALPDRICMDPAPFWFRADVSNVLAGDVGRSLEVATTSHYGMPPFERMRSDYLLRLRTDGVHTVMPRYAMAALQRARSGEHYLVFDEPYPPAPLPCRALEAKERIDARMFEDGIAIAPDHPAYERAAQATQMFELTEAGAVPRYGLSMSRLQSALATLTPEELAQDCSPGE